MQSTQLSTSCSNDFKSIIVNKGFMILEEKFLGFGYHFVNNSIDHLLFQKKGNDYDFFEIRVSNDKIFVSVPIKTSRFQYKTHFLSYFEASEYVEMQLIIFESKDEEDEEVSEEIQTGQANKKDVQASEDAQANEDNE